MANRTFDQNRLQLLKRTVEIWGIFSVSATVPALQRWNYPQLGGGTNARTYTAAPATGGGTTYPTRYVQGADGIFSVARTGVGLWTVTMQDNYQRLLGLLVHQSLAGGLGTIVAINENTTISNMSATGGSVIGVALLSSTATAADPAGQVAIRFTFQDATEP